MYKDLKTMSFKTVLLSSLVVASVSFAQEAGAKDSASVESRQYSLLEKLTNYEANALGFAMNGNVKGGYWHSTIDSDDLVDGTTLAEASAYTHMNLVFSVRPSSKTVAKYNLRFHKDWQNAHREGNNSPITTWWSYDGKILNDHVKFNMGHMRVGYTPFTVYQPMPDMIFEPTIFAEHRKEVMADKNLDGSNDRLMQGLNAEVNTGKLGIMDDLFFHGTLARIRNVAKKKDQVFFDFDLADRYFFGIAGKADIKGITVGVNEVYTFDHVRSSRTINLLSSIDTLYYERNNVLSFELGFDSKRLMPSAPHFGANVEFAMSHWSAIQDNMEPVTFKDLVVIYDSTVNSDGTIDMDNAYYSYVESTEDQETMTKLAGLDGKTALRVNLYGDGSIGSIDFDAQANVVKVDKDFQAELAMTPATLSNIPVLNSDAAFKNTSMDMMLQSFRSGSLENLYFSTYEAVPLNSANMMVKDPSQLESEYYRLYNNYKYAQYYRNTYNTSVLKRSELLQTSLVLDPSANIALPFGYATPNRTGGDIDLTGKWNDAIAARILFGYYMADEIEETDVTTFHAGTKFMHLGGGLNADIARLVGMNKVWAIQLGGSYETTKETDGWERTSNRIMAGFDVTWNKVSLLGGFQMLSLEFGVPYIGILDKTSEMLLLGGLRYKLAAGAYATVEYGYMTNSADYLGLDGAKATMDITKNIIMADVTVNF